jgi:hypothetical protein
MQYRLSTLFLIFFVVTASLAAFGLWGLWAAGVVCFAAYILNHAPTLRRGITSSLLILVIGLLCCGPLFFVALAARSALDREWYFGSLCRMRIAVQAYTEKNGHFPPAYLSDKNGRRLRSWLVELLPYLECETIYRQMNKDEPWNSPHNTQVLAQRIHAFTNPVQHPAADDYSTNYVAIIGPGTIWKAEGAKTDSDLPNGRANTIVAVETADSEKHWAEPFALTVDEVLENMRTGKGVRISTYDSSAVFVMTADGEIHILPTKLPLSFWRQILEGTANLDAYYSQVDPNAPDMFDVCVGRNRPKPGTVAFILSGFVWLSSAAWLFRGAVKSRKVIP